MNPNLSLTTELPSLLLYRETIERSFKDRFIEGLNRGKIIESNELTLKVIHELGFNEYPNEMFSFLNEWYLKIENLSYLHEFIINQSIDEIILHNNEFLQFELNGSLHHKKINNLNYSDFQLSLEVWP